MLENGGSVRRLLRKSITAFAIALAASAPAFAAPLLPENFFDQVPSVSNGQAAVESDRLVYQRDAHTITATGDVGISYLGYSATADRLVFNQATRDLELVGNVHIVDPKGVTYTANRVTVTGGFKKAVLDAMVMVTPAGAMVTSTFTERHPDGSTYLRDATYSPCGTCIDSKGRRIGWRVRSRSVTNNPEAGLVDIDQPVLEILGVPVAWLPWLRLPSLSNEKITGFRSPRYAYNARIGFKFELPYYYAVSPDIGLVLTPGYVTEQGFLMSADITHDIAGLGSYSVSVSGIKQRNPGKFAGEVGERDFRGAIQTSGAFTPTERWTTGWSYTAFTDPDFLPTYLIPYNSTNEVYGTYLAPDTYADVRVQEFLLYGNVSQDTQNQQALAVPNARGEHVVDLGPDGGEVVLKANVLGVKRGADAATTSNGIPYTFGYQGTKIHATGEASWRNRIISRSGIVTMPTLGLRLDAANYDGGSASMPNASTLLTAMPFAALDVRYPLQARAHGITHVVEPVVQAIYHGSDRSLVGITNDNAQSYVFDDTNLFSFNRFSGTDRQETGLRANIGAHYQASFDNGNYIDLVAGQAFHLSGANAFSVPGQINIDRRSRFADGTSELVAGAQAGVGILTLGAKAAIDPDDWRLTRTSLAAGLTFNGWVVNADYAYSAPMPSLGTTTAQQDVGGSLSLPLADYWSASTGIAWDITRGQLINYSAGVTYDDGYFLAAASVSTSSPDIAQPQSWSYLLTIRLKGPDGSGVGVSGSGSGLSAPGLAPSFY